MTTSPGPPPLCQRRGTAEPAASNDRRCGIRELTAPHRRELLRQLGGAGGAGARPLLCWNCDRYSDVAFGFARDRRTEGERIVGRSPGPGDAWADDYPFEGDVGAVGGFLRATAERGEQRPFGYYRITRVADGRAVGGIGFKGRPVDGCVEIGYGLVPSSRGQGYATEAVIALLAIAGDHGVWQVRADTTPENIASQRTLSGAGFHLVRGDDELHHYEADVGVARRPE